MYNLHYANKKYTKCAMLSHDNIMFCVRILSNKYLFTSHKCQHTTWLSKL